MDIEEEIAREIREYLPGTDGVADSRTIAAALMPLVRRAQAEALDRAVGAIADLRPNGITVIANLNARRRDEVLWEAQSTVQRMVRDVENEGAGA